MAKRGKEIGDRDERCAVFDRNCLEDLKYWVDRDRKVASRLLTLIEATLRDPFQGLGKPEPLKYLLEGCWSRQLSEEHRLVYYVDGNSVHFLQARYHYER